MLSQYMKRIISTEYLFAAVLVALFYVTVGGFAWYWLIILFLAFDVSIAGYLVNKKVGAITYNIGHSLIGPAILLALYVAFDMKWMLFVTLLWLFHIFVDRAQGYGLKHFEGFEHTHLGKIGKAKKAAK